MLAKAVQKQANLLMYVCYYKKKSLASPTVPHLGLTFANAQDSRTSLLRALPAL